MFSYRRRCGYVGETGRIGALGYFIWLIPLQSLAFLIPCTNLLLLCDILILFFSCHLLLFPCALEPVSWRDFCSLFLSRRVCRGIAYRFPSVKHYDWCHSYDNQTAVESTWTHRCYYPCRLSFRSTTSFSQPIAASWCLVRYWCLRFKNRRIPTE